MNSAGGHGVLGDNVQDATANLLIPEVANPLTARMQKGINTTMDEGQTMVGEPFAFQTSGYGASIDGDVTSTLQASHDRLSNQVFGVAEPIPFDTTQLSNPNNRINPKPGDPAYPLTAESHPPAIAFSSKDYGADASEEVSPTLRAGHEEFGNANGGVPPAIAFDHLAGGKTGFAIDDEVAGALRVSGNATGHQSVLQLWRVRRLTPRECERLMGMPDDYTLVPFRGKPAADGPRYKGLGNSWPINVPRTIGERMGMIDKL